MTKLAITFLIVDDDQDDLDFMKKIVGEIDSGINGISMEYPEEVIYHRGFGAQGNKTK